MDVKNSSNSIIDQKNIKKYLLPGMIVIFALNYSHYIELSFTSSDFSGLLIIFFGSYILGICLEYIYDTVFHVYFYDIIMEKFYDQTGITVKHFNLIKKRIKKLTGSVTNIGHIWYFIHTYVNINLKNYKESTIENLETENVLSQTLFTSFFVALLVFLIKYFDVAININELTNTYIYNFSNKYLAIIGFNFLLLLSSLQQISSKFHEVHRSYYLAFMLATKDE